MDFTLEQSCFDADSRVEIDIEERETETRRRFQPISVLLNRFDDQVNEITRSAHAD